VRMPLFILMFVFLIAGVLLGGFAAWLRQGRHRRASRALRSDLTGLRREVGILNARLETQDDARHPETRDSGTARVPLPPPMI
ncbi:MAG: LapA family protein, partial [Pseudorhodoplanes sp.]